MGSINSRNRSYSRLRLPSFAFPKHTLSRQATFSFSSDFHKNNINNNNFDAERKYTTTSPGPQHIASPLSFPNSPASPGPSYSADQQSPRSSSSNNLLKQSAEWKVRSYTPSSSNAQVVVKVTYNKVSLPFLFSLALFVLSPSSTSFLILPSDRIRIT